MAKKNFDTLRERARRKDPRHDERVAEYKRAMDDALALAQIREAQNLTQSQLAQRLDVTQANVSLFEQRMAAGGDIYLSTLEGYIGALGGRLEIHVVFEDGGDVPLVVGERPQALPASRRHG